MDVPQDITDKLNVKLVQLHNIYVYDYTVHKQFLMERDRKVVVGAFGTHAAAGSITIDLDKDEFSVTYSYSDEKSVKVGFWDADTEILGYAANAVRNEAIKILKNEANLIKNVINQIERL